MNSSSIPLLHRRRTSPGFVASVTLFLLLLASALPSFAQLADSTMLQIGSAKQFFFDDLIIESAQNLTRRVHKPVRQRATPVLHKDQPWEHVTYFTVSSWNVIRDPEDGYFKCWYEDWKFLQTPTGTEPLHSAPDGGRSSRYLYARSKDGVQWEKPLLGLVKEQGRDTNIVFGDPGFGTVHAGYVFLDPRTKRPEDRYKMIYNRITPAFSRYEIASSPDGIRWRPWTELPGIGPLGPQMGDVLTISLDPYSGIYRLNARHPKMGQVAGHAGDPFLPKFPRSAEDPRCSFMAPVYPGDISRENRRRVFRAESSDFVHWTDLRPIVVPDPATDNLDDAFYGMTQIPLGDSWVGFLHVLHMTDNTMHVELVYSRDGSHFRRVQPGQAWLEGTGREGDWDRHMVNIYGAPVAVGDELFVYYGGSSNHHDWWIEGRREGLKVPEAHDLGLVDYALGLIRMPADRFVSLTAREVREGILVTRPFLVNEPGQLVINAACREGGYLKIGLAGEDGKIIPGFGPDDCDPIQGDQPTRPVSWKGQTGIPLRNKFIKLQVFLKDADLFSFQVTAK